MASRKTRLQQKAAKEKRKKLFAIGGSIVLVAVLAIQVPRTMRMLDSGAAPQPAAPAAPAPTSDAAPAPGAPPAQQISATASAAESLPDPNAAPAPEEGQLASFELFASKDPFVQQVKEETGTTAAPASTSTTPGTAPASGAAVSGTGEQAAPGSAVILVNGSEHTVEVSKTFPADDPAFVLVSASGRSAKIGIAGGTFADGAGTVLLTVGKKLTLVNTVDGTRYELVLVSTS